MTKTKIKKEAQKPIKVFTLDTETRGLEGEIFRIGIFDGEKYHVANNYEKIKRILLRESITYDVHIYIHNLEFDVSKIAYDLYEEIIFSESLIINSRATIIKSFYFTFHDSFSLYPMSLDKLCKEFDVKDRKKDLIKMLEENEDYHKYLVYKNKVVPSIIPIKERRRFKIRSKKQIDKNATLDKFFREVPADDLLLNDYLEFDCRSLYEIIMTTIEISGLEIKDFISCPTTASLSMKIYKQLFPDQYETATSSYFKGAAVLDEYFLRDGYSGGRTEVFIPSLTEGGFHYDFNSLYPYCMREFLYPCGKYQMYENPDEAEASYLGFEWTGEGGGLVEVTVDIPEDMFYPILPYRDYNIGRLIFPTGEIKHVWTFHELKFAVDRGVKIKQFHRAIEFERMSQIFIGFVNHFEKLKVDNTPDKNHPDKKINLAVRAFSKTILNALYGKFATTRKRDQFISEKEIPVFLEKAKRRKNSDQLEITMQYFERILEVGIEQAIEDFQEEENTPIYQFQPFGGEHFFQYTKEISPDYIQVQIAAYVTSYARMTLYKAIEYVHQNGGRVFYVDTDSLITDIELPKEMIDETEFGKLSLESELETAEYLQPKVYMEETKEGFLNKKMKGVMKAKIEELTKEEILYIRERQKKQDVDRVEIISLEEQIKNKIKLITAIKRNKNYNEMINIQKSLNIRGVFEKRIMDYENNTSKPHHMKPGYKNSLDTFFEKLEEANDEELKKDVDHLSEMLEEKKKMKIPNRNTKLYEIYSGLELKLKRKYFSTKGEILISEMADKYECMEEDILFMLENHNWYYAEYIK